MTRRRLLFESLENRLTLSADFSGNGTVGPEDLEIWKTGFGTVTSATQSTGDSDGDMDVDGHDLLAWQRELGSSTAPLVAPRGIESRAIGNNSIEVTWEPSVGATSYIVIRRQPDTETQYTIIDPNVVGTSFIDTGLVAGTLYEYRVAAQVNPQSAFTPPTQSRAELPNLTAYRPQWVQDFDNPTDGPIYERLTKWEVFEEQEDSSIVGPGIRINADDDNQNGLQDRGETSPIPQENDLIEVKIDRIPGSGDLSLSIGGRLQVFYHHDRTQQILSGDPLGFVDDTATVFVEWVSNTHGTDFLTLVDEATQTPMDSLRFHSFRSIVIVFGGNTQSPYDSDGDGFMGDEVEGIFSPEGNREGFFDMATQLYLTGWDVMAFGEEELTEGSPETTIAYQEVVNAIERRFVGAAFGGGFSFMGYSQGGGAIHDIIEAVYNRDVNPGPEDVTSLAVYLDAVDHNLPDDIAAPETRRPSAVAFMLNLYQTIDVPRGNALDDQIGIGLTEDDVTEPGGPFDLDTVHQLIDDDLLIRDYIFQALIDVLDNR